MCDVARFGGPFFPGYYEPLFTRLVIGCVCNIQRGSACVFEWRVHDGDIQVDGGVY